jgi:hypothetical protein
MQDLDLGIQHDPGKEKDVDQLVHGQYPCTKIHGTIIPHTPKRVLDRIYGNQEWTSWSEIPCQSTHLEGDGKRVLSMTILRVFSAIAVGMRWYDILRRMFLLPNSQVKNFLVACRTYTGGEKKVKVCLRGSKGGQGSGTWHLMYALYLAQTCEDVVLDCFDYNEVADTYDETYAGHKIRIHWIPLPYEGDGSGYDVLIDDAWLPGEGPVPLVPKSRYWSLKGRDGMEGYIPFLHDYEVRRFSHAIRQGKTAYCPCMVCKVCSDCAVDFDQYLFLRDCCSYFGHETKCGRPVIQRELVVKGTCLRALLTNPTFCIRDPQDVRSLLSLQEEVPLRIVSNTSVQYDPESQRGFRSVIHKGGFTIVDDGNGERFPWLENKRVTFFGVSPMILGATKIRSSSNWQDADVAFCRDVNAAMTGAHAPILYISGSQREVVDVMKGWRHTGRTISSFAEYVFDTVPPPVIELRENFLTEVSVKVGPYVVDSETYQVGPYYKKFSQTGSRFFSKQIKPFPYVIDHDYRFQYPLGKHMIDFPDVKNCEFLVSHMNFSYMIPVGDHVEIYPFDPEKGNERIPIPDVRWVIWRTNTSWGFISPIVWYHCHSRFKTVTGLLSTPIPTPHKWTRVQLVEFFSYFKNPDWWLGKSHFLLYLYGFMSERFDRLKMSTVKLGELSLMGHINKEYFQKLAKQEEVIPVKRKKKKALLWDESRILRYISDYLLAKLDDFQGLEGKGDEFSMKVRLNEEGDFVPWVR